MRFAENRPTLGTWFIFGIICGGAFLSASAQTTTTSSRPAVDPQAVKILQSTFARYAGLTSYQYQEKITLTAILGDKTQKQEFSTRVDFQKPNQLLLERPAMIAACDGKRLIAYYRHPALQQYTDQPAPKVLSSGDINNALLGETLDLTLTGLLSKDAYASFVPRFDRIEYAGRIDQDSKPYDQIRFVSERVVETVLIDPETFEVVESLSQPVSVPEGQPRQQLLIRYDNRIVNAPIKADRFTIVVPASAKKVDRISFTRDESYTGIGKALPKIILSQLDPEQPAVDPSRLLGKITFITFWASWCGPCRVELPELQNLYDKYHAQGFNIIAVDTDKPEDRGQVDKFIQQARITYPVLLDPEMKFAKAIKLADSQGQLALPSMVIINHEGKLVEAHHGLSPVMEFEFSQIIESALKATKTPLTTQEKAQER
jgi:peroxiredoxin/outer membrane lipoprotein-sorting protein